MWCSEQFPIVYDSKVRVSVCFDVNVSVRVITKGEYLALVFFRATVGISVLD